MRRRRFCVCGFLLVGCDAEPPEIGAPRLDGSIVDASEADGSVRDGSTFDAVAPRLDASQVEGGPATDGAVDASKLLDAALSFPDATDAAMTPVQDAGVDWTYWVKNRGEARSVAVGLDGSVHVACTRRISDALTRSWHVQLNSDGELLGNSQLTDGGTPFENTQVNAVVLDMQGNAYFAGSYAGPQRYTAFVRRRNADLNWGWHHSWAEELSRIDAMTLDTAGRLVAVGEIYTESFIGPLVIERRLVTGAVDLYVEPPELANHFPLSVVTDADGNIYIAGYQYELFGEFPTSSATRGFFAKVSATGTHLYTEYLGKEASCDSPLQTRASAITLDSGGSLWVAGLDCDSEVFLRKFVAATAEPLLNADAAIESGQNQVLGSSVASLIASSQRIRIAGVWTIAGVTAPALRELALGGEPLGGWMGEGSLEPQSAANAGGATVLTGKASAPDAFVQRVTLVP